MIAMALACDPKILIADEPTTALDVTIQAGILDLLRELRERLGTAIVLITHNLGVVADIADRVIVMYAGRKARRRPSTSSSRTRSTRTRSGCSARSRGRARRANGRLQEIPGRVPVARASCPRTARSPTAARARTSSRGRRSRRCSEVSRGPPRRVLPSRRGRMTTARDAAVARAGPEMGGPVLEVDRPRQALPGREPPHRRGRESSTPSTASRSRSARRGARARRRVGQRQDRPSATASRGWWSRRTGDDPPRRGRHHAPVAGESCGRSAARCTSSSRIRTRRSTRG